MRCSAIWTTDSAPATPAPLRRVPGTSQGLSPRKYAAKHITRCTKLRQHGMSSPSILLNCFHERPKPEVFGKWLYSRFRRSPRMENRAIAACWMRRHLNFFEAMA